MRWGGYEWKNKEWEKENERAFVSSDARLKNFLHPYHLFLSFSEERLW